MQTTAQEASSVLSAVQAQVAGDLRLAVDVAKLAGRRYLGPALPEGRWILRRNGRIAVDLGNSATLDRFSEGFAGHAVEIGCRVRFEATGNHPRITRRRACALLTANRPPVSGVLHNRTVSEFAT